MAFDELKENLSEVDASVRSYLDSSQEYYKLKVFKFLMKGITSFSKILVVGTMALLAMLFLSLAASYGIGQALGNLFFGFLIVALFYVVAGALLYIFRNKLNKPLLKKFSEYYFDEI